MAPDEFAAQMNGLAQAGFHPVTLDQVQAYWKRGTPLPDRPIVLSFDNGYISQYTKALPVLNGLHWHGIENLQLSGLPPSQGGLNDAQIKGLVAAGWELDTQGYSHADLITLHGQQLQHEVADARRTIQDRYHVPVNWFCYPSGHYDSNVVDTVRQAGYVGSTTVVSGWANPNEDAYRLPRIRALGGTSPQDLLRIIAGARNNRPPPPSYNGT